MTKVYDALIVGGGLAGSAVAIRLASAGRSVVLIEKEKVAHDKVCGEFISKEGLDYLDRLGISVPKLGSSPIDWVRIAHGDGVAAAPLNFRAQSLSRRILDDALLDAASKAGVEVRRGSRVRGLRRDCGISIADVGAGDAIQARVAFLATGKHDLKDHKRKAGQQNDLLAFKWYWRLHATQTGGLSKHIELILFGGGYGGLQLVENQIANLCVLVRRVAFAKLGSSSTHLLQSMIAQSSHLATRLHGAQRLTERPLAIASIPYGYVASPHDDIWRLGDQAAVIPSFSGDGMSIALHSAHLAATRYLEGADAPSFQAELRAQVRGQVWRATALSQMLVRSTGQFIAFNAARLIPRLMSETARLTRVPQRALVDL